MKKLAVHTVLILFCLVPGSVFSANISVPLFELSTHGEMDEGIFGFSTSGRLDILIEGGYKFGGRIVLGLEGTELEKTLSGDGSVTEAEKISRMLMLKAAGVTINSLFSLPIDLTYFTGVSDTFCSGDDFPAIFGTRIIASDFRGPIYFPTGITYDGIHTVNGTGIVLESQTVIPWLKLALYGYQDAYLGTGTYSVDFRSLLNIDNFKLETFAGASFPVSDFGVYRGGLLLYYSLGGESEFLAQLGIPFWDPSDPEPLNQDHFYFLFEPRISFGNLSIIMSLFKHPQFYRQTTTGELSTYDFNVNFLLGGRGENTVSGGLENTVRITLTSSESAQKLNVKIFPYLRIVSSSIIWDLRLGTRLFPFKLEDMFEGYIGIRTEF